VWRVDLEVDGLSIDALVASCYPRRLVLNLTLDLREVVELPSWDVMEFRPFALALDAGGGMWDMYLVAFWLVFPLAGDINELEDERSSSDDAAASGEKVSAYDVLEDGGLS
jgi:hypothetical protein